MITTDPAPMQCLLLQKRLAASASEVTAYYFDLPHSPFIYQYYNDGKNIFGAVVDKKGNCLQYLPKIEPN